MTEPILTSHAAEPTPDDEIRDLFLSYNRQDGAAVLAVKQLLQERGVSTFLDKHDLIPGTSWFDALERALGRVRAVAVFVGREGFGAWQKREMHLALDRQANDERRGESFPVIPVVLPGADTERASGFLLLNTWVDLRGGLNAEPALSALAQAVWGRPSPAPPRAAPELCPYRALRAFREEDAPFFFGREVFAEELLRKVLEQPLVAVVGPSGSGKSSLVQAGLLPRLRRQRPPAAVWDAVVFTPGERPFHKLAAALVPVWEPDASETDRLIASEKLGNEMASGGVSVAAAIERALWKSQGSDRVLLVVDQFEELFRQTAEADATRFISSLLRAAVSKPVTIVLTLRADFYGRAIIADRELSDALQQGVVNVGAMKKDELRLSVVEPARQVGLEFERGLVSRILDDVQEEPGNLPLLEFALTELWERRQGHLLTHAAYTEIGGAAGALANRAEAQFKRLSPARQELLLRVLTRLIRFAAADEEGRDTRRRVESRRLSEDERSSLAEFVDARLVVSGRDEAAAEETVELAHESLIRLWPRLGELLGKDREFLLWRQRLGLRLSDWLGQGRDRGLLLGGVLLSEARRIARERGRDLNELEREYIHESEVASRRPRRRLAVAAAVVVAALLTYAGGRLYFESDFYQARASLSEGQRLATSGRASPGEWARRLILSGRVEQGLAFTRGLESPSEKAAVLTPVADALARIGRGEEAKGMASEAFAAAALDDDAEMKEARSGGENPLDEVSRLLVKRWQVEDVLAAGRRIEKPDARARALTAAAGALVKQGRKKEAAQVVAELLPAARAETDASTRSSSLAKASELLADSGEIENATRVADEALESAHQIEEPSGKASAVGTVAEALFKVGDAERAKTVTEEALALVRGSKDISFQSMTMMGFSEALVRSGKANEVMDTASGVENPVFKFMALPQALAAMVKNGMTDQALAAMEKTDDEASRYMGYMMIAFALAADGKSDAAVAAARKLGDEEQRSFLVAQVALLLAGAGKPEQALDIARSVENTEARPMALLAASLALVKKQRTAEALASLKGVEMPEFKLIGFMLLLDELPKYERPEAVRGLIADGQATAAKLVSNDMRCWMLMTLGSAQAKLRDYREARQTVEPCAMPQVRLEVYGSILLEYTKEHSPEAAKVIREFEEEKDKEEEEAESD